MIEALPLLALVVAVGCGYAIAVRRLWRRRDRRLVGPIRVACFALGLVTLAGALTGPLDRAADERFSAHMAQHTLLVLVAAPLLVLGQPITVLVLALSPARRRRTTTPMLRSRAARLVCSPPVALATFVLVLACTHLPAIYDTAVEHQGLHDLEHFAYLVSAALFWMAVLGSELGPARFDYPARLLHLFLAMGAMAVIGVALSMSRQPLYPHYVAAARAAGYSALPDQHTGGVIMWTTGMVVVVPAMAAVVLAWLAADERRTVALEQRHELRRPPEQVA